ncbi:MAG TPA: peptidoglycan DD-metalloendopeptidase family protein [Bacillota bacterium]|nr:peptidoglycan DD-metalloendopeptidase family protein [Bacillota bacterium]
MPENDNTRNYINFWPFDSYKDGVRRHWEWLRRWLLASKRLHITVLSLIIAGILVAVAAGVWHIVLQDLLKKSLQPANSVLVKTGSVRNSLPITGQKTESLPAGGIQLNSTGNNMNKSGVRESLNLALPMVGKATVPFGMSYSTLYEDFRFHNGVDILSTKDDVVKAVLEGQVQTVNEVEGEGLTITIKHKDGYLSTYSNITSPEVTEGQKVKRGQALAKVEAETGTLHFAIQKGQQGLNPLQYLSY